jgi:hypothetical protein
MSDEKQQGVSDSGSIQGDNMGWFVAYGMVAAFFVYTVANFQSVTELFCEPSETNCAREWISASGGWAALLAAIPTVMFLRRQILAAESHHRTTMLAMNWDKIALANYMIVAAEEIDNAFQSYTNRRSFLHIRQLYKDDSLRQLAELIQMLLQNRFDEFERNIQRPRHLHLHSLVASLRRSEGFLQMMVPDSPDLQDIEWNEIDRHLFEEFQYAARYAMTIRKSALEYLRDTAQLRTMPDVQD